MRRFAAFAFLLCLAAAPALAAGLDSTRVDIPYQKFVLDNGLTLTGGGALLRNLDVWMSEQLNVPVTIADDPLTTVARGTAICLEHLGRWKDGLDAGEDV